MFCLWERLILGLTKYVFAFKKMIENLLHTVDSLVCNMPIRDLDEVSEDKKSLNIRIFLWEGHVLVL